MVNRRIGPNQLNKLQCEGCGRHKGSLTRGKWWVVVQGHSQIASYHYQACYDCNDKVRDRRYKMAVEQLKAEQN
jgi:hypothetical protein